MSAPDSVALTKDLLAFDTINPPGRERGSEVDRSPQTRNRGLRRANSSTFFQEDLVNGQTANHTQPMIKLMPPKGVMAPSQRRFVSAIT